MTLNEQLEREQQQEEQKKHFVANPLPEFEPFVVKKSNKPIVVPDDIALNTDLRAQERQEFEDMLRRKEMEEEATKENMRKLQMVLNFNWFLTMRPYLTNSFYMTGERERARQKNPQRLCP